MPPSGLILNATSSRKSTCKFRLCTLLQCPFLIPCLLLMWLLSQCYGDGLFFLSWCLHWRHRSSLGEKGGLCFLHLSSPGTCLHAQHGPNVNRYFVNTLNQTGIAFKWQRDREREAGSLEISHGEAERHSYDEVCLKSHHWKDLCGCKTAIWQGN